MSTTGMHLFDPVSQCPGQPQDSQSPTMSATFLTVDVDGRRSSHHRSRSSGYVDDVEDRERRDRRECEKQMKRYHDSKYYTSSTNHQRSTSDYLSVSGSGVTIRNTHSNDDNAIRQAHDQRRGYKTKEFQPSPRNLYDLDPITEPVRQSPPKVAYTDQTKRLKRPAIKVEIHQDNSAFLDSPADLTPRRSPSANPHSPTTQPELQYQYAALQNRLTHIGSTCATYALVEAASPQDLTFTKIAEQVDGFAFDIQVWAHIVCLDSMARIDSQKRHVVETASRNLERLLYKVAELDDACARAKPKDLKLVGWPQIDNEMAYKEEEDDGNQSIDDLTDSLAFIIHSCLQSIELQLRTLKRLSRSLQEATPDAREEVIAITKLVHQTAQHFGSQTALMESRIDSRFNGRRALDESRYAAA
ncbi:hypothetical protein LEMA_P097800.1 [Plenodomus lingam JN3]|uniref:Uncharacterized protein n=2 Tax=Leptosphaeria maculans TaxID=5022 RepID=E5A426_LEPMJ|nr:hypothetical protein LEMA_P097800.1 [Plenodomus lingam JN3]CBX98371.1 hypothetical protein LEMA_P097800.1 [Plenodomus lingam JN3]